MGVRSLHEAPLKTVDLSGEQGNAMFLIAQINHAMSHTKIPELEKFYVHATLVSKGKRVERHHALLEALLGMKYDQILDLFVRLFHEHLEIILPEGYRWTGKEVVRDE